MTAGQQIETTTEAISIHLAEYAGLRSEIDNRTRLANQLVFSQLTVLGAGFAVFERFPDVLLGLAAISACLWLFWIDHLRQIYKIGSYIALRLAPLLRNSDKAALGWEKFLREVDAGGAATEHALYNQSEGRRLKFGTTSSLTTNTMLLFGAITLILTGAYVVPQWALLTASGDARTLEPDARCIAVACTMVVWATAMYQALSLGRMQKLIARAILARTQ